MLTGTELLTAVKEFGDGSKSALVKSCGYVSTKKDGSDRLNFTAFYFMDLIHIRYSHLVRNTFLGIQ